MKILAFESSAKAASVAYCEDGVLKAQYWQNSGLTHSRTLLQMAEDMLNSLEMKPTELDALAVSIGPGSFTGIRIGVAAVKGFAWALEKKVCGVSTLEAMAYHLIDREEVVICPVMDARRSQVYNAKFCVREGKLERLCPDRAISIPELIAEAENDKKPYFLVGDGADLCYNKFLEVGIKPLLAPAPLKFQSAWGVAAAAEFVTPQEPDDLNPNYLRLSQAERERLEREKRRTEE